MATQIKQPKSIVTAIAGGIVGSLLTAALLVFAAPQYLAGKIVRQGMLAAPQILTAAHRCVDRAQPAGQESDTLLLFEEGLACATQGACDRHAKAGRN